MFRFSGARSSQGKEIKKEWRGCRGGGGLLRGGSSSFELHQVLPGLSDRDGSGIAALAFLRFHRCKHFSVIYLSRDQSSHCASFCNWCKTRWKITLQHMNNTMNGSTNASQPHLEVELLLGFGSSWKSANKIGYQDKCLSAANV